MTDVIRNAMWCVLLLCVGGCGGYRPTFSSVDVSCTSSSSGSSVSTSSSSNPTGNGTWTFSSWVEDGDGTDDIVEVVVTIQDFAGSVVTTVALANAQANFWSDTLGEDALGLECSSKDLYLFTFQATDSTDETASMDYVP